MLGRGGCVGCPLNCSQTEEGRRSRDAECQKALLNLKRDFARPLQKRLGTLKHSSKSIKHSDTLNTKQ